MDSGAFAGAGILALLVVVAALVFLVMLFIAPIKLYSIHREIRQTNDLLKQQIGVLAKIEDRNHDQVRLLAALANAAVEKEPTTP
jgi:cell division protein FtsL